MVVYTSEINLETESENQIIDISLQVRNIIKQSGVKRGTVTAFIPGATGAITTMEYEPRLVKDTLDFLEKLVPKGVGYHHDYQDDNAHSHIKATLLSPDITIPIIDGAPVLGTWQQIVFFELDTRGRERKIFVTVIGEK